MESIRRIKDFRHIEILTDSQRLAILRLLMAESATLSQLGLFLGMHPAQVRYHLKQLENAGLVELVGTRVVRGFVEKYYRAKARAFWFQEIILPSFTGRETITVTGSHDLAMEILARHLGQRKSSPLELLTLHIGSLEGLIALRQGFGQVAGCHLLDMKSGEYNTSYIHHLFPDQEITLVTLAYREQGLLVAPGNPRHIRDLEDLGCEDLSMINRNRGSGTRLWLDYNLRKISLPPQSIRGYSREVRTHTAVAETISQGKADAGIGLKAAARQFGLDFIPLFQERYDLAIPKDAAQSKQLLPLLEFVTSAEFRRLVKKLDGYQTGHSGDTVDMR
jgi:putative molybdopterin biosynthesis protein